MDEFVVGVDGSDHSTMALRWAAGAGDAAGVPVRAVQSWIHPRSSLLPIAPLPLPAEDMDEQTERATSEFVSGTLGVATSVTSHALRGLPAGALLGRATPATVLVLGSRGLGGFSGLLLGSASQECVEYAPCPVTVVRTDQLLGDGEVILVGKDGSDEAQHALGWALELAKDTGAEVRVVHAWRTTVSERPPGNNDVSAAEADRLELSGDTRFSLLAG